MKRAVLYTFALALAGILLWMNFQRLRSRSAAGPRVVALADYHGWNALEVHGDGVVAVAAQGIGRVMDLRFSGEEAGPFWHAAEWYGKPADAAAPVWRNFGGDQSWPTPGGTPPPAAFDQSPHLATVLPEGGGLQLESPLDPASGIKCVRTITPGPHPGSIAVRTTYYKESGPPVELAVRVRTQLKLPELLAMPASPAAEPRVEPVPSLNGAEIREGLVLCRHDAMKEQTLGSAARRLVWVGETAMLRIDLVLDHEPQGAFPDNGCSAQIHTWPGPAPRTALETRGPLVTLKVGDLTAATNVYTLLRRQPGEGAFAAAQRALQAEGR